ncbi:50S ribosomal protein L25 [Candidatus Saccharibacteria bacterium]|nr:50S ribosomal protein L25 [Candidatus Saccharibacteria bacterium]
MSENTLTLEKRTETGKKLKGLREAGKIPSVIYGGSNDPILAASDYNATEKVLHIAGYHSTIDLDIDGKKQLAIVKDVAIDPVSRKIINVEFQAVSADQIIEATAPIVIANFDGSDAAKLHLVYLQVMEEIDVKAKPSELPEEIIVDGSKLAKVGDKLTVADIVLPAGVEFADKEMSKDQVIANVYDPAAEAAAREAADKAAAEAAAAAEGEASAEGEAEASAETEGEQKAE